MKSHMKSKSQPSLKQYMQKHNPIIQIQFFILLTYVPHKSVIYLHLKHRQSQKHNFEYIQNCKKIGMDYITDEQHWSKLTSHIFYFPLSSKHIDR